MRASSRFTIGLTSQRHRSAHRITISHIYLAISFLLIFGLIGPTLSAQPRWARDYIKQSDTMVFHSDAPAAVLYHETVTKISANGSFVAEVRKVVKVLSEQGIESCKLNIGQNDNQEVRNIKGWRTRPSGATEKLEKESMAKIGHSGTVDYSNHQVILAHFPSLQVDDVATYEYEIKGDPAWEGFHHRYTFQRSLPVVLRRVNVELPNGWELRTSSRNCEQLVFTQDGNKHSWTATALPYQPDEPFTLPVEMNWRTLQISCYSPESDDAKYHMNWRGVAGWTSDLYDSAIEPDSAIRAMIPKICGGASTKPDSIAKICEFVRDEIRYVSVELGEGRFRPRSAAKTFANRYGDCKDKATLVRSLLAGIDVPSFAVLASIDNPVDQEFPSPFQFNHAILSIPCTDKVALDSTGTAFVSQSIYFDPTDESTAFGQLPIALHGTKVLQASPDDTGLVPLPMYGPDDYRNKISVVAKLDEQFAMSAHVRAVDYGYRAVRADFWRERDKLGKEKEHTLKSFGGVLSKPSLTNFTTGHDADSAWVEFDISSDGYVTQAGPMLISRIDFLPPLLAERFSDDERHFAIWLGIPRSVKREITWSFPTDWKLTSAPMESNDSCGISCFEGKTENMSDAVHYRFTYTCTGDTLSAKHYESARRLERAINSFQGQQLVLEKRGE